MIETNEALLAYRFGRNEDDKLTDFWKQRGYKNYSDFRKKLKAPQLRDKQGLLHTTQLNIDPKDLPDFNVQKINDHNNIFKFHESSGVNFRLKFFCLLCFLTPVRLLYEPFFLLFRLGKIATYGYKKEGRRCKTNFLRIIASPIIFICMTLANLYGLIGPQRGRQAYTHLENLAYSQHPCAPATALCFRDFAPKDLKDKTVTNSNPLIAPIGIRFPSLNKKNTGWTLPI